jgi:predicted nucleic-acid-binding Zn-ribbon protein
MLEPPSDGQSKACPQCGSTAVFHTHARVPGSRVAAVGHTDVIPYPEHVAAWQCRRCDYVEPWHPHREELKAHLRGLRSCLEELLALAPYTVTRAKELSVESVAYTLLSDIHARQSGIVADALKESLTVELDALRESATVLDAADVGDHDRVRSVATTLLERGRGIERLLTLSSLPRRLT